MPFSGSRMKALRDQRNIGLQEFGKRLGLHSYQIVARYEKGEVEPGSARLEEIADILGTTVDYLLQRTDDPDPITAEDRRWLRDIHSSAKRQAAFEEFRQKMLKQNPRKRGVTRK
jgi:transcriptional regulator with XRE-family HTH domain